MSRIGVSLGKFRKIEIIPSIFSDHSAVRLDLNYRRKTIKKSNNTPDNPNNTPDNPNNTPDDPTDDKDGLGAGAIVGIVIGSVVVVGIGGFALVWFVIKKKSFADLIAVFMK